MAGSKEFRKILFMREIQKLYQHYYSITLLKSTLRQRNQMMLFQL